MKLTDSTVDELDTKKEILVMWAFKTVLLLNYSVNYREIIPKSHFKELYKGKIPKNVIINIAFTEDDAALSWVQTIGSPIVYKNKLLDLNEFNEKKLGYKITYQLKHLLIKVVYYDLSFNTEFSDSGGMTIYPEFYLNEPFQAFKNLTQYSSSGTIYEV